MNFVTMFFFNFRDDENATPLHFAANSEVACLLVDHGAKVNAM